MFVFILRFEYQKFNIFYFTILKKGLDPKIHLGMTLEEIQPHMHAMVIYILHSN